MRTIVVRTWVTSILLGGGVMAWVGCQKEDVASAALEEASAPGTQKIRCPQQTVHYTALAPLGGSATPPSGQINAVYAGCYPPVGCASFSNPQTNVLVGCAGIWDILDPPTSWPNVTYAEQLDIINYFRNLASANAPICSGTTKKVVVGMKIFRDPLIPIGVCAFADYACCEAGED